jgi:DNA-binding GntR family transcriptional regulator
VLPGPEALAREIVQGLALGRFAPGQRLAEPDLMARFGVGRSTVREALGRLVSAGVVERVPHRGAAIRRLTRREAVDVLRVAASLLALAARQAAEAVAAGADATGLQTALAGLTDPVRGRGRYYRALTHLAGNAELMRLMPSMQVPLLRAQLAGHLPDGAPDHAGLVAAVVSGDADLAETRARDHVARLLAAMDRVPEVVFVASG